MEEREIDPRIRKANAFVKLVMIAFDGFYPDEELPKDALREKCFFKAQLMDSVHKINRIKMKES